MKCTSKQAELGNWEEGRTKGRESDKGIVRLHVSPGEDDREGKKIRGDKFGRLVRRHDSWNNGFGKF